jgi:hypothetical protein
MLIPFPCLPVSLLSVVCLWLDRGSDGDGQLSAPDRQVPAVHAHPGRHLRARSGPAAAGIRQELQEVRSVRPHLTSPDRILTSLTLTYPSACWFRR